MHLSAEEELIPEKDVVERVRSLIRGENTGKKKSLEFGRYANGRAEYQSCERKL